MVQHIEIVKDEGEYVEGVSLIVGSIRPNNCLSEVVYVNNGMYSTSPKGALYGFAYMSKMDALNKYNCAYLTVKVKKQASKLIGKFIKNLNLTPTYSVYVDDAQVSEGHKSISDAAATISNDMECTLASESHSLIHVGKIDIILDVNGSVIAVSGEEGVTDLRSAEKRIL